MNELKFPFKFKHPCHDFEFTATRSEDGEISITWDDGSGIGVNKDHTYDDVIHCLKEGYWTLEPESTPQKDERDEYIAELEAQVENLEELITMLAEENEQLKRITISPKKDEVFKPISEMTLEDWQQACEEGWEFEMRNGETINIFTIYDEIFLYPIATEDHSYTLDGRLYIDEMSEQDIIRRIK